jgi:hypothetical protein
MGALPPKPPPLAAEAFGGNGSPLGVVTTTFIETHKTKKLNHVSPDV